MIFRLGSNEPKSEIRQKNFLIEPVATRVGMCSARPVIGVNDTMRIGPIVFAVPRFMLFMAFNIQSEFDTHIKLTK
jgi:hypothetical protein